MTMFSGLVCVAIFVAFGSCTGTAFMITGTVIRKMMSSTSITSTSGVVLMVVFSSASSLSGDWHIHGHENLLQYREPIRPYLPLVTR